MEINGNKIKEASVRAAAGESGVVVDNLLEQYSKTLNPTEQQRIVRVIGMNISEMEEESSVVAGVYIGKLESCIARYRKH